GFLVFEIENRSGSAYRLASVRVIADGRDLAGAARLASAAIDRDSSLIGVVLAGTTARGIVTVRSVNAGLNRPLALALAVPGRTERARSARTAASSYGEPWRGDALDFPSAPWR